jgi:nicotinamidase/pyrazinamidase
MKRMLLIIDPQIDFINGALPVPGAAKALNALSNIFYNRTANMTARSSLRTGILIIIAPSRKTGRMAHALCSEFNWRRLFPALFKPLYTTHGTVTVLYKGTDEGLKNIPYSRIPFLRGNCDL